VEVAMPGVASARAIRVSVPFRTAFGAAGGSMSARESWIVRLRGTDGMFGWGEIPLPPGASPAAAADLGTEISEAVGSIAVGRMPQGLSRAVAAGFGEALEQLREVPERHLGAASVPVNATIGILDTTESVAAAISAVEAGFDCIKVKVGAEDASHMIARIRAVRSAVGPGVRLRIDANESWTFAMAQDRMSNLGELNIEYVEQPLASNDFAGHATLRRQFPLPLALDDSVDSVDAVGRILAAGAADVLVVKPARVGGPEAVRTIAALAAEHDTPVVMSTLFETGVGVYAGLRAAASLPVAGVEHAHGLATAGMLAHDLLTEPLVAVGGRIVVPAALNVDEKALARFEVDSVGSNE